MRTNDPPVESLKNIGPTIARRLREVGVRTKAEPRAIGPVAAFQRIRRRHPGKTIPVCYYLYSLQGAIVDIHWDELRTDVKASLRRRAGVD